MNILTPEGLIRDLEGHTNSREIYLSDIVGAQINGDKSVRGRSARDDEGDNDKGKGTAHSTRVKP